MVFYSNRYQYDAPYHGPSWYGYGSYGGYVSNPYGGYLSGAGNVINAQGQYLINTQRAYLTKEQVRSAMIDNRRKALD